VRYTEVVSALRVSVVVLLVVIGAVLIATALRERGIFGVPSGAPYQDASLAVEMRIDDLLARMTLAEKIGQMALVEKNSIVHVVDVPLYGLGGVLSGGGGKPAPNTPGACRDMVGTFALAARSSRLGIPIFYGVDANHGHANVPGATVFPHAIGLGAANDEAVVEEIARVTARELNATGVTWNFAPSLDLPGDIRWGRVYEAFSDDPARTARLGAAFVRGSLGKHQCSSHRSTILVAVVCAGAPQGTPSIRLIKASRLRTMCACVTRTCRRFKPRLTRARFR